MSAAVSRQLISFGPFEFDPTSGLLFEGDQETLLPPKAAGVLRVLLESSGELVTKDELLESVWEGSFVTESSLSDAVSALRRELIDDPHEPAYIQTIHRRGYRFIAEVSTAPAEQATASFVGSSDSSRRTRKHAAPWLWAAAGVVAVLAAGILLDERGVRSRLVGTAVPRIETLAVLPLVNSSGDPAHEPFAEGISEALSTEMTKIGMEVRSWRSSMLYGGSEKTLPEIAKELNVDALVVGTVRETDGRARVTVQLVHAASDEQIWAEYYDRDLRNILDLYSDVARTIAAEIQIELTAETMGLLADSGPVVPEAHRAYLWGNYFFNKSSVEGWQRAVSYYEEAIEKDPQYAPAHAALAHTLAVLPQWGGGDSEELSRRARAAVQRATELDDSLARAHLVLGQIALFYDWDWATAERESRRAIDLEPGSADAHMGRAVYLSCMGQREAAVAEVLRAVELDPISPTSNMRMGAVYFHTRHYDEAIEQLRTVLDMEPRFGRALAFLSFSYKAKEQYELAEAALEELYDMEGVTNRYLLGYGYLRASLGEREEALLTLDSPEWEWTKGGARAWGRAVIYGALGELDEAFRYLDEAYAERSLFLAVAKDDPRLDPLRDDPRFDAFLLRMDFPQ